MKIELDNRWIEFWSDDACQSAIGIGAVDSINFSTEPMTFIFGWEAAKSAWRVLAEAHGAKLGKLEMLGDLPDADLAKTRIFHRIVDLYAYAYYGLPVRQSSYLKTIAEPQSYDLNLSTQREAIDDLIEEFGCWFKRIGSPKLAETFEVTEARSKLDVLDDTCSISVKGLAGLAKISVKSLRNRLSPSGGKVMKLREDGTVAAGEARTWLHMMKNYRTSLWTEMAGNETWRSPTLAGSETIEAIVFVPLAPDGSFFSKKDKRDDCYVVGVPGLEQEFENFEAALDALTHMVVPQWRRQTPKGRWTSVRGVGWERKELTEIGPDKESEP